MLAVHDKKLKDAYAQQKKAYDLGMFCLKYKIDKAVLHALAHDEHLKEQKRREHIIAGRYE